MPHTGYFLVTCQPEQALEIAATVQAKARSVLAYTNVAGSGVEMFFIQTQADPETVKFSNWDGRKFAAGALHGKDGAKRGRVRKTLNGLNNGAFSVRQTRNSWVHTDDDGVEWQCARWPLPGILGDLTIVLVPEEHNANDNDGLITEAAARKMAAACNAKFSNKTDFVQMLLLGYTGVYKCAAEILRGQPSEGQAKLLQSVPQADVFIGEAGASRKVWLENRSMGRITLWNRKQWEPAFVTADALQTFLRWRSYFNVEDILGVGSAMLRSQLREDQIEALTAPVALLQEQAEEEWEYQNESSLRSQESRIAWQLANEAEYRIGSVARQVNGSPFAWNEAISFKHGRVARIVQSMVNANRSGFRGDAVGMPAWVIPGQYMMLMNHDFAGVKQPKKGWVRKVSRFADGGFYGYTIHPEDFDSPTWEEESDTSDYDDKSSLTPAVDATTNETYDVILRRPSSPYGGSIRRATKAQTREWSRNTGMPVLRLREDWQEQSVIARGYIDLPKGISTGPARVPQPATNDLEAELAANIWSAAAGQGGRTGISDHRRHRVVRAVRRQLQVHNVRPSSTTP